MYFQLWDYIGLFVYALYLAEGYKLMSDWLYMEQRVYKQ